MIGTILTFVSIVHEFFSYTEGSESVIPACNFEKGFYSLEEIRACIDSYSVRSCLFLYSYSYVYFSPIEP